MLTKGREKNRIGLMQYDKLCSCRIDRLMTKRDLRELLKNMLAYDIPK